MNISFDEEKFMNEFINFNDINKDISLKFYKYCENFSLKNTVIYNKKIIKYYYGTIDNAIKVYEKNWHLDFDKEKKRTSNKHIFMELAAITLYYVFYKKIK